MAMTSGTYTTVWDQLPGGGTTVVRLASWSETSAISAGDGCVAIAGGDATTGTFVRDCDGDTGGPSADAGASGKLVARGTS